ncbi:MAG: hypothetical protein V1656_01820 [Candidatus Jorgensenbacteria bacterium]
MYELTVSVSAVLLLVSSLHYAWLAWEGKSDPVLATWILMMVMMGLSCWMYFESPNPSWTANINVTAGMVNIAINLIGVTAGHIRRGTLGVAFDRIQSVCLVGGVVVVVLWFLTRNPYAMYVMVQVIALIALFGTARRLWGAVGSTEPVFLWVVVFFAGLCAIYPAVARDDEFAQIYLARAIPSVIFMIHLVWKAKKRGERANLAAAHAFQRAAS